MKITKAAIAAAASRVVNKRARAPSAALRAPDGAAPWRPLWRAAVPGAGPAAARRLAVGSAATTTACDASFMQCLASETCKGCFTTLQENAIDWTNVVPDTPCQDVLGFLVSGGHCAEVRAGGDAEVDTFCAAFDSCIVWDDEAEGQAVAEGEEPATDAALDCASLTECAFSGLHEHFLGDGVCHDALPGCYNSKACNYDGGDCCEDTCHGGDEAYGGCGSEEYACADPVSEHCVPAMAHRYKNLCASEEEDRLEFEDADDLDVPASCLSSDDTPYRLIQYDSWGDGWDTTLLTLREHNGDPAAAPIYEGSLAFGAQGTEHVCLTKKEPKCYHVTVENAVWGNEISWELRSLALGGPVIAAGGSPSDCSLAVGGPVEGCTNDCGATRPETKIADPNYSSYKSMEACIEEKCVVQVGSCVGDETCVTCMQESTPDYCYENENFSVLIDCTMCSCQVERPDFCDAKQSRGDEGSSKATHAGKPEEASVLVPMDGTATGGTAVCGPDQTMKGTAALLEFSSCSAYDEVDAMLTSFDNNNFGLLDMFETCAHTYQDEPMHGGKEAMDCMKILHNTATSADLDGASDNISKAISSLAHHLYHNGEEFCECTAKTNKLTPTCSSFVNFKTLLFEAVDACRSLDAIDCAAWEEFYFPCKENLVQMFETMDFQDPEQCHFVENKCGGAGPFPAFRRLDCGKEIAKPAWDFHTMYSRGCLAVEGSPSSSSSASKPPPSPAKPKGSSSSSASKPQPSPAKANPPPPAPKAIDTAEKKQYKPYSANGASDAKKPYFSAPTYTGSDPEPDASASKSKKHHFLRTALILAALASVGFVLYKRRRESFNYVRFRQMREARNYAGGSAGGLGEYTGVSVSDSCTFEPPTLPPTPL